nr:10220_t:CDS:10 [Entrophospora candida]
MSLTDFLADQSTGSWADEMEDLPSAPAAAFKDSGDHDESHRRGGFGDRNRNYQNHRGSRDSRYDSPREPRFPGRSDRPPQPLPTSPPYTAHLGNLPYDLTETDVSKFFVDTNIATIRILRDKDEKPKGFGYVEFKDLESLSKALDMTGEVSREDRTAGEWRRSSPRETPSSSPRNERFNSADRYGYKEDNRWGNDRGGFRDRGSTHYGHRGGSGGDRGGDRGDRGGDRGDRGSDRGDRGSDRGDRGSDRGDRNSDRGDRGDRGGFGNVGGGDRPERKPDTEWKGGAFSGGSNSNIRSGGYRDRRSEGGHRDPHMKRNDTRSPNYNRRESSDSSIHHILRKKLELKPRSTTTYIATSPTMSDPKSPNLSSSPPTTRPKSNPFGEAKPIDTVEALRKVEERSTETLPTSSVTKPIKSTESSGTAITSKVVLLDTGENVKKNIKVEKADMELADIPVCHRPEKGKSGPALKINLVVDDASFNDKTLRISCVMLFNSRYSSKASGTVVTTTADLAIQRQ